MKPDVPTVIFLSRISLWPIDISFSQQTATASGASSMSR
jgi:hypothetical protein